MSICKNLDQYVGKRVASNIVSLLVSNNQSDILMLPLGENYKDSCGPIGWASYHFVNESEVYINWWEFRQLYEDGSKVTTKYFENISFDSPSRTFKT